MSVRSKLGDAAFAARGVTTMLAASIAGMRDGRRRTDVARAIRALGVYRGKPSLPRIKPADLIGPIGALQVEHAFTGKWQVELTELAAIVGLAVARQAKSIFEFGTFDGRTSRNLLANLPEARLTSIDLPIGSVTLADDRRAGELLEADLRSGRATLLEGNTLTYDFSPHHGRFDFVFIDAGHSYECALSDSMNALRLSRGREAAIVWHDYASFEGVTRAVHETRDLVTSPTRWLWVEGTFVAVMICEPGRPLAFTEPR